jgi:tRNA (guanine37-N1)-methyltransferase
MRIDIFALFPDAVEQFCSVALLGRARRQGVIDLRVHDLRDGAGGAHRSVDDAPFGGGAGMVLMPAPVFTAVEAVEAAHGLPARSCSWTPGAGGSTSPWPAS